MNYLLPNLAFEEELLHPERSFGRGTLAAIADLAPLMALVANSGDRVILDVDRLPEGLPLCLQHVQFVDAQPDPGGGHLIPWGWTKRTESVAENVDQSDSPSLQAVHSVNSREFLSSFDKVVWQNKRDQVDESTFGQRCNSLDQFYEAVSDMQNAGTARLVVKPEISHAGRNRIFVDQSDLNDQQNGWLRKRIHDGVYVEPWVVRQQEWSVQFDIPPFHSNSMTPKFVGATQLLNDPEGRYAGNILLGTKLVPELAIIQRHAEAVCAAAQAAGYHGPLGIDSFQFRDSAGNEGLRLCNDINARFTMGRLALHFEANLKHQEFGAWCQFSQRNIPSSRAEYVDPEENAAKILVARDLHNVSVVRTSSQFVGGKPVRTTTLLLTGPSIAELIQAQQVLHGTL